MRCALPRMAAASDASLDFAGKSGLSCAARRTSFGWSPLAFFVPCRARSGVVERAGRPRAPGAALFRLSMWRAFPFGARGTVSGRSPWLPWEVLLKRFVNLARGKTHSAPYKGITLQPLNR